MLAARAGLRTRQRGRSVACRASNKYHMTLSFGDSPHKNMTHSHENTTTSIVYDYERSQRVET